MDHYATHLTRLLQDIPPFAIAGEEAGTVQVERAVGFVTSVLGGRAGVELPAKLPARVVDERGHRRAVYPGLLVSCALASRPPAERAPLRPWVAWLETLPGGPAHVAWTAVARDLAGDVTFPLPDVISAPRLEQSAGVHPEAFWYDQLVILHAAAAIACWRRDETLLERVRETASHVQDEIQPDHATTDPWALNAMLLAPETYPLADQMLHSVMMQTNRGTLSLILLGHCLYCLKQLNS